MVSSNLDLELSKIILNLANEDDENKKELARILQIIDNKLTSNNQESKLKIQELEVKNKELEVKIQELEVKNKELEVKIQELEVKNKELEVKIQELEVKNKELEVKDKEKEVKIQELEKYNNILKTQVDIHAIKFHDIASLLQKHTVKLENEFRDQSKLLENFINSFVNKALELQNCLSKEVITVINRSS
jgi:chromosome segregation ATPase